MFLCCLLKCRKCRPQYKIKTTSLFDKSKTWFIKSKALFDKSKTWLYLFLSFYHTIDTNDDEWYREYLSHIEWERGFEGFLNLLRVLNEEAEGEDVGQAEAEIPACADFLGHLLMQIPHDAKEDGIGDGLVELAWMTRQ